MQSKQPATQILTAFFLQQRRWDRAQGCSNQESVPFGGFCAVKCHSTIQIRSYQIPISTASRQFCLWFPCFAHGHLFVEKGLRGVHADKSAASICKLRQWRSQQPSCLDYIVLDDRLPVIDCNIICECSVTATREGSPVVQSKQPATQILTALLLRQRRWDRATSLQDSKLMGAERISFSHCTCWRIWWFVLKGPPQIGSRW